jgi:hypothetical protein
MLNNIHIFIRWKQNLLSASYKYILFQLAGPLYFSTCLLKEYMLAYLIIIFSSFSNQAYVTSHIAWE